VRTRSRLATSTSSLMSSTSVPGMTISSSTASAWGEAACGARQHAAPLWLSARERRLVNAP
jgi:hypothetical protein